MLWWCILSALHVGCKMWCYCYVYLPKLHNHTHTYIHTRKFTNVCTWIHAHKCTFSALHECIGIGPSRSSFDRIGVSVSFVICIKRDAWSMYTTHFKLKPTCKKVKPICIRAQQVMTKWDRMNQMIYRKKEERYWNSLLKQNNNDPCVSVCIQNCWNTVWLYTDASASTNTMYIQNIHG